MTLLARDEADIVDAQIAFHLHAGVDFVVATDNRSRDGTTEILRRHERAGVLHLVHEQGDDMRQDEWVTRMARLAATDFGADWVINADADEFWWPRVGTLKEVLSVVPQRFGIVRGAWRHFVPRPDDERPFAERMTARLRTPAHPGDKRTIFHAHQKVAHRARPDAYVERGNHEVHGVGLEPIRGWHPIEVLHFSLRDRTQLRAKAASGVERYRDPEVAPEHQRLLWRSYQADRLDELWRELVVDDEQLLRGLADGTYALDTRLRDALRFLRRPGGGFGLPSGPAAHRFSHPPPVVEADFAAEVAPLAGIDGIVRAEKRVAALESRLERLEREPLARLRRLGLLSR